MNPENMRFTKNHEWISITENTGTVGITDYAQRSLGDITFVEMPLEGKEVYKGEEVCSIESAKAASPIYAPLDGVVDEGNSEVEDMPSLVNESPYESGWIYKIHVSDLDELELLMDYTEYNLFVEKSED